MNTQDQEQEITVKRGRGRPSTGITKDDLHQAKKIIERWIIESRLDNLLISAEEQFVINAEKSFWENEAESTPVEPELVQVKLNDWLADAKINFETRAERSFTEGSFHNIDGAKKLQEWVNTYLSKKGWERLRGNLRQRSYKHGYEKKTGNKERRQQVKSIPIKGDNAMLFNMYRESKGMSNEKFMTYLLKMYAEQNPNW